jgi:hypothetical protein
MWPRLQMTLRSRGEYQGLNLSELLFFVELQPPLRRLDVSGRGDVAWTVLSDQ